MLAFCDQTNVNKIETYIGTYSIRVLINYENINRNKV